MLNFEFQASTKMLFGKGQIKHLPNELNEYGENVLLVYGGGSIKRNGIYETIYKLCSNMNIVELSGVEPNPRIETVKKGAQLCRDNDIDVVLAVGGGSTIDCAKVIAGATFYDGEAWDLVIDGSKVKKALPLVTILTLAATGTEMNRNAVISNLETNEKLGTKSSYFLPKVSILDPVYLYSLPASQTAAGTADIMSHVFESYFNQEEGTFVQDKFAEGLLHTCIKYCPIALQEPDNYEARANLMWASSMALNGLTGSGKGGAWTCHTIEHELSAFYDITHGVGLAILTPRWMRYVLDEDTVDKFVEYGVNVWRLTPSLDRYSIANKAIDLTEQFFNDCGLPSTLTDIGIGEKHIEEMAELAIAHGRLDQAYVPLIKKDVINILKECL